MKRSAGILLYKRERDGLRVLLAHPGGPFWRNKDAGAWSIPKGEIGDDEEPLAAALREFAEETGVTLAGDFIPLGEIKQKGGKTVIGFALERDLDPSTITSNTFAIEWPPRSGRQQTFPEIDRAEWFDLDAARAKINAGQAALLDRLVENS
ncbi:MAG: NUDIX domain-containing protein [Rhizobiales bacterium]|nr:NUDIX domain-containing protein [Hyphomicrobiales bacterium]